MANNSGRSRNSLLSALDNAVYNELEGKLEHITLEIKQSFYEDSKPIEGVYFPLYGVASVVQSTGDNKSIEVATIGNEGFVGIPVFLGVERTQGDAFCQIPGEAMRLSREVFRELLAKHANITTVLNRYLQALMIQIAQGTACNGVHTIEQRCARWLLMSHDRMDQKTFPLTQEFLSQMLGTRRSGVTEVASRFQDRGLIRYVYGVITILKRRELELASCGCYWKIRSEFDQMRRDLGVDRQTD